MITRPDQAFPEVTEYVVNTSTGSLGISDFHTKDKIEYFLRAYPFFDGRSTSEHRSMNYALSIDTLDELLTAIMMVRDDIEKRLNDDESTRA